MIIDFLNVQFAVNHSSTTFQNWVYCFISNQHCIPNLPPLHKFWDVEITLVNKPFSLLASTLVNHLYNPPTKLINLKSFKSSTPRFLGINTRKLHSDFLQSSQTHGTVWRSSSSLLYKIPRKLPERHWETVRAWRFLSAETWQCTKDLLRERLLQLFHI